MLNKAITIGMTGNNISKKITGSEEVSVGRTTVATGTGAILGGVAGGTIAVGIGVATAPVTVPLAIASGIVAGVASLFD